MIMKSLLNIGSPVLSVRNGSNDRQNFKSKFEYFRGLLPRTRRINVNTASFSRFIALYEFY